MSNCSCVPGQCLRASGSLVRVQYSTSLAVEYVPQRVLDRSEFYFQPKWARACREDTFDPGPPLFSEHGLLY